MKNPLIPNGNRLTAPLAALALAAAINAGAENFYWRGTADNPVWDTTTANWAADASTSARKAYQSGTAATIPETDFDSNGATENIYIGADGVQTYVINYRDGSRTWSGGPVTAQVLDPLGGALPPEPQARVHKHELVELSD